jgi:hypothetical protein
MRYSKQRIYRDLKTSSQADCNNSVSIKRNTSIGGIVDMFKDILDFFYTIGKKFNKVLDFIKRLFIIDSPIYDNKTTD